MITCYKEKKLSIEIVYTIFAVFLIGLFLLANYFAGFSLPLYIIVMSISVIIAAAYPRVGLYTIIFLTFIFERFFTLVPIVLGRNEYKLYPIDVIFGAMILGILFQLAVGSMRMKLKRIDWALIWFSMLSVVYFFVSVYIMKSDSVLAFSSAKNYGFYSLLYFVTFILIDNQERLKELAMVVFAGAIGILWFIFYGIAVRHGLWSDYTPLSTDGIRTLAFTHAYYLCMAFIVSLVYMAYRSSKFSNWLLILTPIWIIGIIGSMMRHLWISMFVTIIFLIIMLARNQRERLRHYAAIYAAVGIFLMVVVVYGATLFPRSSAYSTLANGAGMLGNRVTSITDTTGDDSIVWRGAVWQQAAQQYASDPIFGIGYGKKVSVEIGDYHDFVEVRDIHNSFLVILVQMGILGIVLVAYPMTVLGWDAFKNRSKDEFMQIATWATLGILVFQFIAFMCQPYLEANLLGIFFWINLGVVRRLTEFEVN